MAPFYSTLHPRSTCDVRARRTCDAIGAQYRFVQITADRGASCAKTLATRVDVPDA
jgi:hypothetical protein